MQDKLRALVRLAEIDASARGLDEQLEGIPRELEDRRGAVRALEALVAGQRGQAASAEKLLAQQDEEIKQRNDALARSKSKGAKARTMREAEASERELEAIRRSIRDAETEKERLAGVLEQTRSVLSEPLAELEEQKKALAEAEAGSEQRLAELRAEREKVVAGRERWVVEIPKPIYRRYERIRPKIHPAVAEVVDATCTGCRMRLPPQLSNQIQAAQDLYQCPHCQRFLYFKELILE
ncbi:MAG: C4-type zinc ribbon domain-containing protein [Sandaracinaceae bacterium]|nr:C4-type zinc ribbon domain-containing protein [Sandaracinaceae bacterium]